MNVDNGKYEGEWKNSLFHGKGIRTFRGGEKYEGEWKEGKRTGQGTLTWANGNKYEGRFKEGIPWNTTDFDKDQHLIGLHVRGVKRDITPLNPKL